MPNFAAGKLPERIAAVTHDVTNPLIEVLIPMSMISDIDTLTEVGRQMEETARRACEELKLLRRALARQEPSFKYRLRYEARQKYRTTQRRRARR